MILIISSIINAHQLLMKKIYWQVQQMNRIGGAEMVSIDLANHLSKMYDVTLVSTVNNEGDIPYHIEPTLKVMSLNLPKRTERVDVLTKKYLSHFRIFSLLGLYIQVAFHYFIKRGIYRRRMQKLLLKDDALLICSSVDSYLLAPKKGKVWFHFHFDADIFFRGDNKWPFLISRKPDKFIFLTKAIMEEVVAKKPKLKDKSTYILNPIRFEPTLDLTYHNNTILFAGRFNTQKDPMLALKVANVLNERKFPFILKMFGDPIMKKEMDEYIKEHHLENVVELHGPTTEIKKEMLNADMLLLTSLFEGLCLVLGEASALSCPWVSSDWGTNLREVYGDSEAGIIVDVREPEPYADAVMKILDNEETLKEYKKKAYEESKKLSHEAILPIWIDLFEHN